MAIFNSYVSLPEGNIFTVRMSCSQYRWRNCFVKHMVKISISRKDLLGYSSSITKCRWSLGWSWGIPSVKLTGWAGHSYSLFFLAGLIWEYMYVCIIYIYAVCAHTCTICTSQPKHTRSWQGMQDWPCRYQALVSVKLSWQAFLCGWVSVGLLTGSCWTSGFVGHLMTHPKSIEKWQSNPTNPWI